MSARNSRKPQKLRVEGNINSELAAALRGDKSFHEKILAVHKVFVSHPSQKLTSVNAFLVSNNFRIPDSDYGESLRIDDRHLEQLDKAFVSKSDIIDLNYLFLAKTYICSNKERVVNWIEFDQDASALLLSDAPVTIKERLTSLPKIDQQSLSSLRLYAAQHSYSDSLIREYLEENLTSAWMKARLLYPIIYYYINLPGEAILDQMLSHLLPEGQAPAAERRLVKFLLEPRKAGIANLKSRCYIGLLSHPYDTLEYVTHHYEIAYSKGKAISSDEIVHLKDIAAAYPQHRMARLVSILQNETIDFEQKPLTLNNISLTADSTQLKAILEMMDVAKNRSDEIFVQSTLMEALYNLRWKRYPVRSDFDTITIIGHKFIGLTAGRLISFLSYSQYLVERSDQTLERLNILDGVLVCGKLSPFIATAPGGYQAMVTGFPKTNKTFGEINALVENTLGLRPEARVDRVWIKAVNWLLAPLQLDGKLTEWSAGARKNFPLWVEPRYLSGLDWEWLQNVIDTVGVVPFVGVPDGIYVLFMKQLEKGLRESMALRLAIEPVVRRYSQEDFQDWLFDEFGKDAVAIIKLFLTADTILKLRLSDNYTSAVTTRLFFLEQSVQKFGFQAGVLSEAELEREASILTATLSRMSVGARQFEIPWDTLLDDAVARNVGTYDAYNTVSQAVGQALGNAWRKSTYPFSNTAVGEYEAQNRDWPLLLVICGIIDTFLSHPTSGIEAILSARIRHDNFRREFQSVVQGLQQTLIANVNRAKAFKLIRIFEPLIYREVQIWLDRRVHTLRKGKAEAIFNFIPTTREMSDLLASAIKCSSLQEMIEMVFVWIKPRLDSQLSIARNSLVQDLRAALESKIDRRIDEPFATEFTHVEITRVGQAVKAAISRRCWEIQEWFKVPEQNRDQCLKLVEIHSAVQQRFRMDINSTRLKYGAVPKSVENNVVAPVHIRLLYDLFSELVQNALKHSGLAKVRVRFSCVVYGGVRYILISNASVKGMSSSETVDGHPYQTLSDALFGEGKSGTKKIAYLAASLAKVQLQITVTRRRASYHVRVPLAAWGVQHAGC